MELDLKNYLIILQKKFINLNYKKEEEDDEENDKKENNEKDNDGRIQLDTKVTKDDTNKNYCCY